MVFSDFIIYVDESGDHGLNSIDPNFPIFVLAFCVFNKSEYISKIVPEFQNLKFKYWGHDTVILHERDIRKTMDGDFACLNHATTRENFMSDLTTLITQAPFHIIAAAVKKQSLVLQHQKALNPYELSLLFCMEGLHLWLDAHEGAVRKKVTLVFESRGKKEDRDLELEFRRICDNSPKHINTSVDFTTRQYNLRFVSKKSNATGLQIADLVARPVALNVLHPDTPNRAFSALSTKMAALKIFP